MTSRQAETAARSIVQRYNIRGSADPGYIAAVIDAEFDRIRLDMSESPPIIERPWKGTDSTTGLTYEEILDAVNAAHSGMGAKASSVRIVRSYATALQKSPIKNLRQVLIDIAERIQRSFELTELGEQPLPATGARDALERINVHRRELGMGPLDPVEAGWTHQDILAESRRIARLPNPTRLKRNLLR